MNDIDERQIPLWTSLNCLRHSWQTLRVRGDGWEWRIKRAEITEERPLTIYVDKNEIVTLMTLSSHPELLTLGYLFNQRFINDAGEVHSVQVDWEVDASVVNTWRDWGIGRTTGP